MTWKKSSFTNTNNCVEMRYQKAAIRDTKRPEVIMVVDRAALGHLVRFAQVRTM